MNNNHLLAKFVAVILLTQVALTVFVFANNIHTQRMSCEDGAKIRRGSMALLYASARSNQSVADDAVNSSQVHTLRAHEAYLQRKQVKKLRDSLSESCDDKYSYTGFLP